MPIRPFTVFPETPNNWQKYLQESIVMADEVREVEVAELIILPRWIRLALVTDEAGGETLAFKDTTGVWRRCTDLAVCS